MDKDALEALLARSAAGDLTAAEQAMLACEPYLRMVVRRRMPEQARAKFDSLDVVQSVWVDLVRGMRDAAWRFEDAARLRAFLTRAVQRRLIDRLRQHRRALVAEENLGPADIAEVASSDDPRPSEVVQADELWKQIRSACPPAHRTLLELKRQGLSIPEIAARVGLNEGSARRILFNLGMRFTARATRTSRPVAVGEAEGNEGDRDSEYGG